jgi:hypothetical protein
MKFVKYSSLNIIEFVEHPKLLNDKSLSDWQRVILKSTYGIALDETELAIYRRGTGRDEYDPTEQEEVTIIAGRRSGKTSKIAATIAVFEAFRDHGLPPGEEATIMLLAPQIAQAQIAFRSIRNHILKSRILSARVVRQSKDEITLDNGIKIGCYPCSYVAVRGITIAAVICDEMAFWPHDETSANPEQYVLDAVRPGMTTVKRRKLIKISTPFSKNGVLWSEFQRRAGLDFAVWQAPTSEMNPTISRTVLQREQQRDDRKFRREYLAEFSEDVTSWVDREILESCIVGNRTELPRLPNTRYVAAIDPGFKRSDFALAIAHRSPEGVIVLDRVAWWRGNKKKPVSFENVCSQVKQHLDDFSLNSLISDQYYAEAIKQELLKYGIFCEIVVFGAQTRAQIFANLRHLAEQHKVELPDVPELCDQLLCLEEIKTDRGLIDIRPSNRMRDDLAVVVALAANQATKQDLVNLGPQLGVVERFPCARRNCPGAAAICRNFPECVDDGCPQGLKDIRLSV